MPITKSLPVVEKATVDPRFTKQALQELPKKTTVSETIQDNDKELGTERKTPHSNKETEIIDSYDGDSDSVDELSQQSPQNNELGEDFMHDVESEIIGDEESPEFPLQKNENTVSIELFGSITFVYFRLK